MSLNAPRLSLPTNEEPDQLPIVPPPRTIADATRQMHDAAQRMDGTLARLEKLLQQERRTPHMRTIAINPTASALGPFTATDVSHEEAQSIGILNPSSYAVTIGMAGVSAAANSRAIQCPPQAAMVIPVRAWDIELAVPSTVGANSVVVYVFRFWTPQPLSLGDMS
jgi:hypothetical protein